MDGVESEVVVGINRVAFEIREVLEARGHNVGAALDRDEAFTRRGASRSSLIRDLVIDGFVSGASSVGFDLDAPRGGAQQFRVPIGDRIGLFRLRRADRVGASFRIPSNSSSTWGQIDDDTLIIEEPYVFGFTVENDMLGELFIARVTGLIEGSPGSLVLSEPHIFAPGSGSPGSGFAPDIDNFLPGFEDDYEVDADVEETA